MLSAFHKHSVGEAQLHIPGVSLSFAMYVFLSSVRNTYKYGQIRFLHCKDILIHIHTDIYLLKYIHENTQTRAHIHNIHMMDDIRNVIAKNNDPLNFTTYYVQCYKYFSYSILSIQLLFLLY